MYACADVIYGFVVTKTLDDYMQKVEPDWLEFLEEKGYGEVCYTGAGADVEPAWIGLAIDGFDESGEAQSLGTCAQRVATINFEPTDEQKQRAHDRIDKFREKYPDAPLPTQPDVWIVWSTS